MLKHGTARYVAAIAIATTLFTAGFATAPAAVAQSQPGFDGSTIKIAGFGVKSLLPSLEDGSRARVKQFNDDNEVKGIKLDFVEFADDKSDAATALSEARRLVTQEQVFALVPDASIVAPGQYITQQKVPTFGASFGAEYCTTKPSKSVWIFGALGCQTSSQPAVTRDAEAHALKYVRRETGKQKPTVALIANDNATGVVAVKVLSAQFEQNGGWGELVYNKASVPDPVPGDLSPFAQALLTADKGQAPDLIRCIAGNACLPLYSLLRAQGFEGEYEHEMYADALVKPFADSISSQSFRNIASQNPGYEKLRAAVEAVEPGANFDTGHVYGYLATDMFVQALKLAAKDGKAGITRANLQKVASTMTYELPGVAGPTRYPASTVKTTPLCREVVKSNGTSWETVEPFKCNMKSYELE